MLLALLSVELLPARSLSVDDSLLALGTAVQSEPDGGFSWICPLDSVTSVGWDQNVVAGAHDDTLQLAVETKLSRAAEQDDPFVRFLIVPLSRGRGVGGGDDPLEPEIVTRQQVFELFLRQRSRKIGEKVPLRQLHRSWSLRDSAPWRVV